MGALPKKKITRARRGARQTAYKLSPTHPAFCTRCRSAKLAHAVCPQCGYYRGRQVIQVGS